LADGLAGPFTVVKVNTFQGIADLETTDGTRKSRMHIPFSAIHPVSEAANQESERWSSKAVIND
jgi:hypothetical protein